MTSPSSNLSKNQMITGRPSFTAMILAEKIASSTIIHHHVHRIQSFFFCLIGTSPQVLKGKTKVVIVSTEKENVKLIITGFNRNKSNPNIQLSASKMTRIISAKWDRLLSGKWK